MLSGKTDRKGREGHREREECVIQEMRLQHQTVENAESKTDTEMEGVTSSIYPDTPQT